MAQAELVYAETLFREQIAEVTQRIAAKLDTFNQTSGQHGEWIAGRRYPKEYTETPLGCSKNGKACKIEAIHPVKHRGSRHYCRPSDSDWNEHLKRFAESGLKDLGTIHTHDDADRRRHCA